MSKTTDRPTASDLVNRLEGSSCNRDGCSGRLVRRTYKGDDAAVCSDCGVPFIRLWEP